LTKEVIYGIIEITRNKYHNITIKKEKTKMLPVKNYVLTETAQTITPEGDGAYFHVRNNSETPALIAYYPSNETHAIISGEDGILTLDPGQIFHYSVIPSWELEAIGDGELTVMTTEENESPFDGAASAQNADGGDWDITHTYRKSVPQLWAENTEIDWGDGTFSLYKTSTITLTTSMTSENIALGVNIGHTIKINSSIVTNDGAELLFGTNGSGGQSAFVYNALIDGGNTFRAFTRWWEVTTGNIYLWLTYKKPTT
jgi:hypothetical protein